MYMGQDASNPYDIQSLGDRYNAAQDKRRSLGITTSYEVVSIQDLGPYGGDEAILVSFSDGSQRRMGYSDFLAEVEGVETISGMNQQALATPGVIDQFASVGVTFNPLPPMEIHTEVIPPPGPIYAAPTSVPSGSTMPEPVVPNAGLPDMNEPMESEVITELPAGLPAPFLQSLSWPVIGLIAAGIYILARR